MKLDPEFELLVHRYMDGRVSAEEIRRLNELLQTDPRALQFFIERLNLEAALEFAAIDGLLKPRLVEKPPSNEASRKSIARWACWSAASVVVGVALFLSIATWQASSQVCAAVESSVGVPGLADRAVRRHEMHEIPVGTLKMRTPLGVQIVVEAPAKFHFESPQRLHLAHGRLAADVPPAAKFFTVITPSGEAVDLGTVFGVDVPRKGDTEVHVLQGEVIAQSASGGRKQSLRDGEAFRMQPGAGVASDWRSAAFIQPQEVELLHAALQAGQRARSEAMLQRLREEASLIALLDFESEELPAGVYSMVQGRWPGSHAPEFVHAGDHMKLDVGGERGWPKLTLAAWVRLDRIKAPFHSIMHTDGWIARGGTDESRWGQVHWTVTNRETIELAMAGNLALPEDDGRRGYPNSKAATLSGQGHWRHLAAVYDADLSTVRFYVNGALNHVARLEKTLPAQLGPARIGNWDTEDRTLSGRIDELLILGRAMSNEEIHELYLSGNPYR